MTSDRTRRRHARTCRLAALSAALWSITSNAAWEIVPDLILRAGKQENVRLQVDTESGDDSNETVLDARIELSSFNERGSITFEPRVQTNVYSDARNSDLEGEDVFLRGDGEYRWRSVTAGFWSDYRDRSVVRAELLDADDPGDPGDGGLGLEAWEDVDSGVLEFIDQNQERFTLNPYVDFRLSPRSSLRLDLISTEVSYTENNIATRTGFKDLTVGVGVVRRVDERNRVSATLLVSKYEAEINANESKTVGIEGAFTRPLTSLWTFNLVAGVERTDFSFVRPNTGLVDNASSDFTLGVSFRKRSERSTFDLRLQRMLNPSSSGYVTERNQARGYFDYEISQRVSTRIGFRVYETQAVGDVAFETERDYARFEFDISWALRPRWSVVGGYTRTAQEFVGEDIGETTSNGVFIGIRYRGLGGPGGP